MELKNLMPKPGQEAGEGVKSERANDKVEDCGIEDEKQEWLSKTRLDLDSLAEKISHDNDTKAEEKFNELLYAYLPAREEAIRSRIDRARDALPSNNFSLGSGRTAANFKQYLLDRINSAAPGQDVVPLEVDLEEQYEFEEEISRNQADLKIGLTVNFEKYQHLKKAGLLPESVEQTEKDLKLPSLKLLANGFVKHMEEEVPEEFVDESGWEEERNNVNDALRYIWSVSEIEKSDCDPDGKKMLKAKYAKELDIPPELAMEYDGIEGFIKRSGLHAEDLRSIKHDDIAQAEEIVRESEKGKIDVRKIFQGKSKQVIFAAVLLGVLTGASLAIAADLDSGDKAPITDKTPDKPIGDADKADASEKAGLAPTKASPEEIRFDDKKIENDNDIQTAKDNLSEKRPSLEDESEAAERNREVMAEIEERGKRAARIELGTIKKGEGIEHAFQRQLLADPQAFGYDEAKDGDVKKWAGPEAHRIALNNGYVDRETGHEVRLKAGSIDNVSYVLEPGEDGKANVTEMVKGQDKRFYSGEEHKAYGEGEHFEPKTRDGLEDYEYEHEEEPDDQVEKKAETIRDYFKKVDRVLSEGGIGKTDFEIAELDKDTGLRLIGLDENEDGNIDEAILVDPVYPDRETADDRILKTIRIEEGEDFKAFAARAKAEAELSIDKADHLVEGHSVTAEQARNLGVDLYGTDHLSDIDEAKLDWLDKSELAKNPEIANKVMDIMAKYRLQAEPEKLPALYERIAQVETSLAGSGLAPNPQYALENMFYSSSGNQAETDKILGMFFGEDDYKELKGFFKNYREVDRAGDGSVVITFDQSKLLPGFTDQFKVNITPDGRVTLDGPVKRGFSDPKELNKDTLDEVKRHLFKFMDKEYEADKISNEGSPAEGRAGRNGISENKAGGDIEVSAEDAVEKPGKIEYTVSDATE